MEEQRCRTVASATEDSRCSTLLDGAQIQVEDSRYKSLHRRADSEVEDSRCNRVAVALEDPRCRGLASKW